MSNSFWRKETNCDCARFNFLKKNVAGHQNSNVVFSIDCCESMRWWTSSQNDVRSDIFVDFLFQSFSNIYNWNNSKFLSRNGFSCPFFSIIHISLFCGCWHGWCWWDPWRSCYTCWRPHCGLRSPWISYTYCGGWRWWWYGRYGWATCNQVFMVTKSQSLVKQSSLWTVEQIASGWITLVKFVTIWGVWIHSWTLLGSHMG